MTKATLTQPPADKLREANVAVNKALNDMLALGLDDQCVADAMFAYGLSIRTKYHTHQDIARHLYMLAVRFADPNSDPLHNCSRHLKRKPLL